MADFPEGVTLDDLKRTNELLTKCGANITEINTVRKHLSKIKGGQLARILFPATTVCLILSDVVGDRLDVIASGPTVGDSSSFADALTIIDKYSLQNRLPSSVLHYLLEGADGSIADTPKPDNPVFQNVHNYIIGSNGIALESSAKKAEELGFETHTVTDSIQEDVTETANFILKTIDNQKSAGKKPVCLLFGGESTVKVSGKGLGGRNQHLALYLATKICCKKNITILCAGTDGTDGPTDAAGAVVDYETAIKAVEKGIDPNHYLTNCDSYRFFQEVGGHIITGNTGTNVMDIIVAIVQ